MSSGGRSNGNVCSLMLGGEATKRSGPRRGPCSKQDRGPKRAPYFPFLYSVLQQQFQAKMMQVTLEMKNPPATSSLLPVEHEEPGVGAALSGLQGHHQTAHSAAMPAQRLPHVCLGGLGCEWLPASRASCGAQLPGLHAQHALPPPGPQACAQS